MTGLFDSRDSGDLARRNAAAGPPATFGESALSAAEDVIANDLSISANMLLRNEYERYLEEVNRATGKHFANPYDAPGAPEDFTVDAPNPALDRFFEAVPAARPPRRARPRTSAEREADLLTELGGLKAEKFPDLEIRTPEDIRQAVVALRAGARERRADVAGRENTAGAIAAFAAGAVTLMLDPLVLASMAFGAPAATSVLRAAAIDAGIAAAVEVPIQAIVQAGRRRLGEETSLSEAAINVLTVGAGGFLISGLLRGGARGTRGLIQATRERGTSRARAERDALTYLERQAELEDSTPFDRAAPRSRLAHETRLSDAQLALREGRGPVLREAPDVPVRREVLEAEPPLRESAIDEAPGRDVEAGLKDFAQALRRDEAVAPPAAREAAARVVETLRPVLGDDADAAAFVDFLRAPPKDRPVERLSTFLTRQGGVQDFQGELRAIGLPKGRPGLLRKNGLPLDEAGLRAFEAGFFSERPTVAELLDALGEDINTAPVHRPEAAADAQAAAALRAGIEDTRRDLDELGIDLDAIGTDEAVARLRGLAQGLDAERAAAAGAQTSPAPETLQAASEARVARHALEEMEAGGDGLDDVLLRQVRDDFAADLDRRLTFEDFDGDTVERRAGDVFADLDDDAALLREFRDCMGIPF